MTPLSDEFRTAEVVGGAKDGADGDAPEAGIVQKGATGGEEEQEAEEQPFHGVSFCWGWTVRQWGQPKRVQRWAKRRACHHTM